MSSHHFVKEDQEPALVIADTGGVQLSVVQELLEWSPTVVVLERSLDEVRSWGIKIDVVVCSENQVKNQVELLKNQAPIKILSHSIKESPLDTALYFLSAGKYRAVNVVGSEVDALKTFTEHFDLVTFTSGIRWSFARDGKFEKWLVKGTALMVKENGIEFTTIDGLDDKMNVIRDGMVRLKCETPFWVGELC